MSRRVGLMFLAAVIAAVLAAYLAYGILQPSTGVETRQLAQIDVVDVAVAATDMSAGRFLEAADVRIIDWPADSVPTGFSRSAGEVVGRGLLADVKQNEPLLTSKVASLEAGGGLQVVIPPGKRAMSVRVDDVVGVAGFVLPGTRVDVLVTLDSGSGEDVPRTRVLLQNIRVASAGQITERDEQGAPQSVAVVTLLVDPAEAERLALASGKGTIRLALRNSLDLETVETPGVAANRLIADTPVRRAPSRAPSNPRPSPTPPQPTGPVRFEIEVYRGPERSTSTVEERGESSEEEEEGEGGAEQAGTPPANDGEAGS